MRGGVTHCGGIAVELRWNCGDSAFNYDHLIVANSHSWIPDKALKLCFAKCALFRNDVRGHGNDDGGGRQCRWKGHAMTH